VFGVNQDGEQFPLTMMHARQERKP
jgi:hypothetical protein